MAPITGQERAAIIEGSFAATEAGLSSLLASQLASTALFTGVPPTAGALSAALFLPAAALIPPALGLLATALRPRFPRLTPRDIGRTALEIQRLERLGLGPVVGTDPFTGNVAIATRSQLPILPTLLREAAERTLPLPPTAPIFSLREQLIGALTESAVERGFFRRTADIPAGLTGQFIRETADSPLRFVPLSPGVAA